MHETSISPLTSCLCTQSQLQSKIFQDWVRRMGEKEGVMHRKLWEWCYIAQALHERNLLRPGKNGLGFAVGQEPLTALFASYGCEITATDLDTQTATDAGWVKTQQHAKNLVSLNERGLCNADDFSQRVRFRYVDMNKIPEELRGFDFAWSACSLEHLGSLTLGEQFVYNTLACLKLGGVSVHTTEFTISSNDKTVDYRSTVLFRRRDMERMANTLIEHGHTVEPFVFDVGDQPADVYVDVPPFKHDQHLKLLLKKNTCAHPSVLSLRKTARLFPKHRALSLNHR
jgi:hypothetical protein